MPKFLGPGPTPDWRPTPPLITAGVSPLVDDDNDGWWANSQYGFTNIPLAGVAAALSVAVATLGSFAYQDEIEAKLIGASETQRVVAIGEDTRVTLFQDEGDVALPKFVAEDEWVRPTWIIPKAWLTDPSSYQQEDVIPQPATFIPEEDYWLQLRPDPTEIFIIEWPGAGGIVSTPDTGVLEEDWQVWTPPLVAAKPLYLPDATDNIVSPPAPFVPEEDYWLQLKADAVEITVIEWPGTGGVISTSSAPLPFDEEPWQVYTPALLAARPLYLPDPEEIPALAIEQPTESTGSGFAPRADIRPTFVLWPSDDGLPQPAIPLNIDESDWQVWTPGWIIAKPLWLPDANNDLIVPQPLPLPSDEDPWQVYTPPYVAANPLYLPDPEQIPALPQPIPLPIDEEPWQVWTPLWLAAKPLYLPDPEEIPAGSLEEDEDEQEGQSATPGKVVSGRTFTDRTIPQLYIESPQLRISRPAAKTSKAPASSKAAKKRAPQAIPDKYFERSAAIGKAIVKARSESAVFRKQIAKIEADILAEGIKRTLAQRAKLEHDLLIAQQHLILLATQEAVLLEEMEVIDVAFVAFTVLNSVN